MEVSDPDLFFACEHGIRIFSATVSKAIKIGVPLAMNIASRAFAVPLPKPVNSSFLFVSKGVAFENKTEDGCCCLQKQLYLVAFLDEGGVFCFCFMLLHLLFVFHFAFGAFLFITCLHDSQTTYTPSTGNKHVKQYRRTTLASKGNKQKKVRFELEASPYTEAVIFQVEARFLGSIHVRVNGVSGLTRTIRVDTPKRIFSKTDFFENVYVCKYP